VAEFTRAEPSAGSFITYVETGLGPRAGVVTALLVTVAIAGVFTMSGGLLAMTLAHYRHVVVPALGSAVLIVPFVELCEPGQPSAYSTFPFIALGLVAVAAAIAWLVVHRHPAAGSSEATPAPAP